MGKGHHHALKISTLVAARYPGEGRGRVNDTACPPEEKGRFCVGRAGSRLRKEAVVLALLLSASSGWGAQAGAAESAKETRDKLPTLTTAASVHDLTLSDAARHYPVHLRAVCVVCFAGWHGFFVNDGVSGVYVETKNQVLLTPAIHAGTWLEIDGVTGTGEFAPIIDQSTLQVLGEKPLPPARLVSLDHLSTGVEDGQWIAFEGTVRSATFRDSMLQLIIAAGRLQVEVMTEPGQKQFQRLIDARVRVLGAAGPILNQRRQLIGTNVYTPGLNDIVVLQPAPIDPFSLPIVPVRRVFEYKPGTGSDHLVRIRGVVEARWGQTVYVNDGAQGASVVGRDVNSLQPGDLVDAVGYPSLGDAEHTIEDAIFSPLGTAAVPQPQVVTVKDALTGNYEGNVIRMDGRLLEQQRATDQTNLLISAGDTVFSAVLPVAFDQQSLAGIADGSRIQLTGICVISETQASRHYRLPKAFEILLRSPADIVVVESPSWWTPGHAFVLLGFAGFVTLAVFAWVVALRRRVAQQTRLLRDSEERFRHMALHDSLTGLATRLLLKDRLSVALESNRRHGSGLAVLMVDVDHFKEINDTYGHETGDEVLRVTAERLQGAVRREDTVARLGGDEFVVLLPDLSDADAAERIAAILVGTLAAPIPVGERSVPVSASIGACTVGDIELDADALLRNADVALYEAKAGGRNRFALYRNDPQQPSKEERMQAHRRVNGARGGTGSAEQ